MEDEKVCWRCEETAEGLPKGETLEKVEGNDGEDGYECTECSRELADG